MNSYFLCETLVNIGVNTICMYGGYYLGRAREKRDFSFELIKKDLELEAKRWAEQIRDFPHRSTWRCQICDCERIDALIGVAKYRDMTNIAQFNIKYCRDSKTCVDKAHSIDVWCGEKVFPISSTVVT